MRNFTKQIMYFLGMGLLIASCTPFRSNITIPAYQQFILGEYEKGGFAVELQNLSPYTVKVETRNSKNKQTSGFGLSANGKTKVYVGNGEKAILINSNGEKVNVKAKLAKSVEGMRYEVMNMTKIEKSQVLKDTDLTAVVSDNWEGNLTYIDYSNDKEVKIACHMKIEKLKKNTFKAYYIYPDEPHANGDNEVKITEDGKRFEDREVIQAEKKGKYFVIKTIEKGKDNNKEATLYYTYKFNDKELSIRKEVQTIGSSEMKFRNEYKFTKR